MNRHLNDFLDFIRKQGVVGFAVGFILGGAILALVTSLVGNIVTPILGVLLSRVKDLNDSYIAFFGGKIMYGKFINDLINFIVIATVVYLGVQKLGLNKLDKPKE